MIIKCQRCKGAGKVSDVMLNCFTFGVSWLIDTFDPDTKDTCPKCDGRGYLKVQEDDLEEA